MHTQRSHHTPSKTRLVNIGWVLVCVFLYLTPPFVVTPVFGFQNSLRLGASLHMGNTSPNRKLVCLPTTIRFETHLRRSSVAQEGSRSSSAVRILNGLPKTPQRCLCDADKAGAAAPPNPNLKANIHLPLKTHFLCGSTPAAEVGYKGVPKLHGLSSRSLLDLASCREWKSLAWDRTATVFTLSPTSCWA